MPTLYLDFENGNDDYGGTSFSLLASGSNGRITSTTFSSASANFLNDGSLINQYLSIFNGTIYAIYQITAWISSTSLTITALSGGTALADQAVDRQYYVGGRWRNITSGVTAVRTIPGDTIRIMGSPAPTLVGSGTWTGQRLINTLNISSSTNASPIEITTSSHGLATGDTVIITGHTTNTNANGTWEITYVSATKFTLDGSTGNDVGGATGTIRPRTNTRIKLTSSLTQNIASCGNRGNGRTVWTASTNITTALNLTDSKEGDCADSIAVGVAFTTGLAAYKATGSLDLSGYQQLSFWIKQTAGTIGASGAISLKLCSDTAGATAVNTFDIENLAVIGRWVPVTINLGTNLGSSIQSIGFYVNTDNAAQTFLLSNIIACKASSSDDSLNLCSLIGKNTGVEPWCPIQSINGTRVLIDNLNNTIPWTTSNTATSRGYFGTTGTVNTYKRETIKTTLQVVQATAICSDLNESGTSGNNISYQFGYDRTDMSSQTLETYVDGRNGFGYFLQVNSNRNFITINKLGCVRYDRGLRGSVGNGSQFFVLSNIYMIGCTTYGLELNSAFSASTLDNIHCNFNNRGMFSTFACANNIFNNIYLNSNHFDGLTADTMYNSTWTTIGANNNGQFGFFFNGCADHVLNSGVFNNNYEAFRFLYGLSNVTMRNCSTSGNLNAGFFAFGGELNLYDCTINESSEVGSYTFCNGRINSQNHDNTINNHYIFTDGGAIYSSTSVRYSNAGLAWALSPTSTNRSPIYPLDLKIGRVAVSANSLVTIKAWVRRTNTGLTMGLRIKGGQIAGVPSDITSYMSAAADTWQQITLTFTPTEAGVVEIISECYGGSTYTGYIDDLSITQV